MSMMPLQACLQGVCAFPKGSFYRGDDSLFMT
uniref:Uncharacterized protein n=1 Tax=Rhizophora mucronata TaxID=61149 RepID=A0A2P2PRH7_RHIMU